MPNTFDKLATTTLVSAQSTVTFSSINGSYTDLFLSCNVLGNTGGTTDYNVRLNFNSDSSSNYSRTQLVATSSGITSGRSTNETYAVVQVGGYLSTSTPTGIMIHLSNYSNTTTNKHWLVSNGPSTTSAEFITGMWRSSSAITSIAIATLGGQFKSGSIFSLYGIRKA